MSHDQQVIQTVLEDAIASAQSNHEGVVASYIPELACVSADITSVTVCTIKGACLSAGNHQQEKFTLQSAAKLVVLIGLLEERGPEDVYSWVRVEPSGAAFSSVARLDQFGPRPSNPMLNSGAITLCSHIPGNTEQRTAWLEKWFRKLFGQKLTFNLTVFNSERRTGNRNRSLAYLLKSNDQISGNIEHILETYFSLCSFETTVQCAANLPTLLANCGKNLDGEQIISAETARQVISIMATCGLYNESGRHLLRTGMPAKSSVSGLTLAVVPGRAGIAVCSPRVDEKGNSIRGEIILEHISKSLEWHFAQ